MYKKWRVVDPPVYSRGINEMTISNDDINVSDAFGYWFSGFVDGEGCFEIVRRNRVNCYRNHRCRLTINLRDDDQFILEEIRDTLGMGAIDKRPADSSNGRHRRAQARFQVQCIRGCAKLVEIFERFPLRAKKKHDFSVWRCAVVELQKPASDRNPELLEYYFHRIKQVRRYGESRAIPKPVVVDTQLMIDF